MNNSDFEKKDTRTDIHMVYGKEYDGCSIQGDADRITENPGIRRKTRRRMIRSCQVDTRNIQRFFYSTLLTRAGCFCNSEADRSEAKGSFGIAAAHAAYFALYFWIRGFSGIGYCSGSVLANAAARTSAGDLNPKRAWYLPSL